MRRLVVIAALLATMALHGCATSPASNQVAEKEEWPEGIGTIPPSWYDYNPALKHWFDPWYHNPYIAK
jgi:hypothetical protein